MATNNPFDILPANLFNPFSTQGATLQRHYMAILLRLYGLAEFNRYGLTREIVLAEIVDYLKTAQAELEVAAAMDAEAGNESEAEPQALSGQKTENDYAAYLLRRLAETGWVEREQLADYSEMITLPDYTFILLEALRSIQEQKPREFKGQLYAAYQLISNWRSKDFSPALALPQAYENVRQVVRGLNELNQNIRRYIERATRGRSPAELLQLQFDDYARSLGPAYHALKTSDHVSRYRRDIVSRLQLWQHNANWLDRAAGDLALNGLLTPAQAAQEINHFIQFIITQLEELDPLLEEIDRRHAQYLRTSLRQIRYQLVSADGSFKDCLASLGRRLAAWQAEGETELPAGAPPLQFHPIRLPDLNSYYTPPQRRAPFTPGLIVAPALSPSDLAALHAETLKDVTQALTPDKVNRHVLSFFNGHPTLHVRELPPEVTADLHYFTTLIAYADHPEVQYGLEVVEGEPVRIGDYCVVPFEFIKL